MIKIITHTENPELILQDAYSKCYQKPIKISAMVKVLKHESVLEHVTFSFDVKCSRIAHLQMVRHRLASYTSQSHRYTEPTEDDLTYYIPNVMKSHEDYEEWIDDMERQYAIYQKWQNKGYKKEDARYHLPDSCAINFQVTMNLRAILNFLALRTDSHAQEEIRVLANEMKELVLSTMPNLRSGLEELIRNKQH